MLVVRVFQTPAANWSFSSFVRVVVVCRGRRRKIHFNLLYEAFEERALGSKGAKKVGELFLSHSKHSLNFHTLRMSIHHSMVHIQHCHRVLLRVWLQFLCLSAGNSIRMNHHLRHDFGRRAIFVCFGRKLSRNSEKCFGGWSCNYLSLLLTSS